MDSKIVTLKNGLRVKTPGSLNLLTPYILEEQLDWFEDEIDFVRVAVNPGESVIDIGANFGLYSLSMAKIIGETGMVYAFEPSDSTAKFLQESIELNGLKNISLQKMGLSNQIGNGRLSNNENSELNTLVKEHSPNNNYETVHLSTLDECSQILSWPGNVSFIKIDAEGEENNILQGGREFFKSQSPLVMFEIKEGQKLHLELIEEFAMLGYQTYRLVPGINALVSWNHLTKPDAYLLNLFCCKADRAKTLTENNLIISSLANENHEIALTTFQKSGNKPLKSLPYAIHFNEYWSRGNEQINHNVTNCLQYYEKYQLENSATEKYKNLYSAFRIIYSECQISPQNMRLSTLARISLDLGFREIAVNALDMLTQKIFNEKIIQIEEPFLLPSREFDQLPPKDDIVKFLISAILSTLEKKQYFSSYFSGSSTLDRLNTITQTGYADPEILRRINLISLRYADSQ